MANMSPQKRQAIVQEMLGTAPTRAPEQGPTSPPPVDTDAVNRDSALTAILEDTIPGSEVVQSRQAQRKQGQKAALNAELAQGVQDFFIDTFGSTPQDGESPLAAVGNFARSVQNPVNMLMGGDQALTDLASLENTEGNAPRVSTILNTVTDVLSLGSRDKLRAASSSLFGGNSYAEELQRKRAETTAVKEANPGTALTAEIGTSIVSGAALARGGAMLLNKMPDAYSRFMLRSTFGRVLGGATAGGTEAGVYTYNTTDDPAAAARVAGVSILGGAFLSGVLGPAAKEGYKRIVGKPGYGQVNAELGEEVSTLIERDMRASGAIAPDAPPPTLQDMANYMDAKGPGSIIENMEYGEQLTKEALTFADKGYQAKHLLGLISQRNQMMESLSDPNGVVNATLQSSSVRGPQTFSNDIKETFKDLQPKYKAMFEDANARGVSFSRAGVYKALLRNMDDPSDWGLETQRLVKGLEKNLLAMGSPGKAATNRGKQRRSSSVQQLLKAEPLNMSQMSSLRRAVSNAISERDMGDGASPVTKEMSRQLGKVYSDLTAMMASKSPGPNGFAGLNSVYGSAAERRIAYEAAQKLVKKKEYDSEEMLAYSAMNNTSQMSQAGFMEGVKSAFLDNYQKAMTAANPEQAIRRMQNEHNGVAEKLRSVIGKTAVDDMFSSLEPQLKAMGVIKLLTAQSKLAARGPSAGASTVQKALDALIAGGGAAGVTSNAGALGAGRRLVSGDISTSPKFLRERAEGIDEFMASPSTDFVSNMNRLGATLDPDFVDAAGAQSIMSRAGTTAGVGAAASPSLE